MPAVIQTRKGVGKHIDRHTSADNTELGGGTPWVFSPDRKVSLEPDTFLFHSRPRIYTGLPAPDTFLPYSRPRIYTGLPRPAWAPVLLPVLYPFVPKSILPWSRDPRRAPKCSTSSLSSGWERRLLETMQLAIGEFITDSSQGLPPSPSCEDERPQAPVLSGIYWVQLLVGTSGLVTQWVVGEADWLHSCKAIFVGPTWGFLLSPDRFPFFLARHMLIG